MEKDIKNRAHDKAFSTIYSLDTDISRLKQEIKDNITPFITIEQLEGVLKINSENGAKFQLQFPCT